MRREAVPRRQRIVVLATVAALHAVLLALFLSQRRDVERAERTAGAITVVAVNTKPATAAPPPPPTMPAKIARTFKPVVELAVPSTEESDAPAGAVGACSIQGAVLDALLRDPAALDAIRQAPPEMRSIADAIVVWNEGWNPSVIDPALPLSRIRLVTEEVLATAAPECLDEQVTGPRLLPVPDVDATRTKLVVFGSGVWTWRAVLTPPAITPADIGNSATNSL